jgi:UDP-N-acetylglucosamine acyltransferase
MPQIDPTAIVDRRAEIAEGVAVGPWCVVEGAVKIGAGTRLLHRVSVKGPVTVGARNVFYPGVCVGYEPQDRKFDPDFEGAGVVIGDDNIFREGVTIHRATKARPTTIGHRNYLMATTTCSTTTSRWPTGRSSPATSRSPTASPSAATRRCTSSAASAASRWSRG